CRKNPSATFTLETDVLENTSTEEEDYNNGEKEETNLYHDQQAAANCFFNEHLSKTCVLTNFDTDYESDCLDESNNNFNNDEVEKNYLCIEDFRDEMSVNNDNVETSFYSG
ncbi:unnamed protein product, partial [Rotaria sordida]